jgi:predicted RND superfamily exporter protein
MTGLLSGLAGVLTGVGGSLITNIFNLFTTKQKNKHEIDLIDARIREMTKEAELHIQEVQINADIQAEIANQKSFDISQEYGNKSLIESEMILKLFESKWTVWLGSILVFLMAIVDVVRAAMRPAITIVLMLITAVITWQHLQIVNANNTLITAEMISMILESIIYLTFTVVGWWFGDRTIGKFVGRKK